MTKDATFNVASEILTQLGSNKFIAMTGAKSFLYLSEGGLSFRIPGTSNRPGVNYVKITLNGKDLYDIEFGKIRNSKKTGMTYTVVDTRNDVYCTELQSTFTDVTGLSTRLF